MNLNPVAGIIEAVGGVIGDLVTTDKERLAAELDLAKVDASLQTGQMEVNKVEAAHASIFVAGWRPAVGWVCVCGLAYQFLAYPMLIWCWALMQAWGWVPTTQAPPPMLEAEGLWVLLTGMLGIAGARTFEKFKGVAK